MQITLCVARLARLALADAAVDILGDPHVLGKSEQRRVVAEDLLLGAPDQLTERVIGGEDAVLEIGEDHWRHVVIEREAKALLALGQHRGRRELGGDNTHVDIDADVVRGTLIAQRRDNPKGAVDGDG